MRKRVDQLGVAQPEIQRSGADEIDVALPDVSDAGRAEQEVGKTAQLYFYDWEPNVIGADGKPAPTRRARSTGGAQAGAAQSGCPSTRRCCAPPSARRILRKTDTTWSRLHGRSRPAGASTAAGTCSNPSTKRCCAAPRKPKRTCSPTTKCRPAQPSKAVRVNPGTVLVQARADGNRHGQGHQTSPNSWYVLNDNPVLTGADIKQPGAELRRRRRRRRARRTSRSASPRTARASSRTSPSRSPSAARKPSSGRAQGSGPAALRGGARRPADHDPSIDYTKYPEGIDADQRLADLRRLHDQLGAGTGAASCSRARCRSSSS